MSQKSVYRYEMQAVTAQHRSPRAKYSPPSHIRTEDLRALVLASGRTIAADKQFNLLDSGDTPATAYCAGEITLLHKKIVSVVGSRACTEEGLARTRRLARELASYGIVVMSGLAKGVDTNAHCSAIQAGGDTIAVIGTPLGQAYPAENKHLQEEIYSHHLLISPFASGERVFRSNFPKRNRVMALLSDATVIVEASDTSGTLHQAAECLKQGRKLFITNSVANDPKLSWPAKFIGKPDVFVLTEVGQIAEAI